MKNLNTLVELMRKRPELPVVPMVRRGTGAGSHGTGSWGEAKAVKYWNGEDGVYFYNEKAIADAINDPACVYPEYTLTRKRALEVYRSLPWVEAIVIFIDIQ